MRKSVYPLLLTAWAVGLHVASYGQNCPTILNCPGALQTICDPSENDSTLWNEPAYTWSPLLQSADLFDGIGDLHVKALACGGSGSISVFYKIFMDLDGDFFAETVVSSSNLPPPGIVMANNSVNPGFSGGDTLWFDKRPVPVTSKFRFAMETHFSNDTLRAYVRWNTLNNPGQYVTPRLPEGQHSIIWTVIQDGVTRNCQYSFRVTDCAAPTLICGNNLAEDIGPDRLFAVNATQFIDFASDNITPPEGIQYALRKAGTGTGFPASGGNPITELAFNCSALGTQVLDIWAKDRHGNTSTCNVTVTLADSVFICTELPKVCARAFWDSTLVIDEMQMALRWVNSQDQLQVYLLPELADGCHTLDSFPEFPVFIKPDKSGNLLNGVTTFDLLLISKHILAIQALDAPWKIIAADANLSNSVTTNDVVQLRRLILGIINELPGNSSWRFFANDCHFPANPFDGINCGIGYNFDPMPFWAYPAEIRFFGLKTGDVNNSAVASSAQSNPVEDRSVTTLELPDLVVQPGEILDIPLRMEKAGNLLGFQCSVPFDATRMEILDVRVGGQLNAQEFAFAQPEPGMLRVSWFDVSSQILLPGENLFQVRVKALSAGRLSDMLAMPVDPGKQTINSEIYVADNSIEQLAFGFRTPANAYTGTQVFAPQPNPFTSGACIPLRLEQEEQVQIFASDLEGKILYSNTLQLNEGAHLLEIPASAFTEKGLFTWQVRIGSNVFQGKLVRL